MRSLAWICSGGQGLFALWIVAALAACGGGGGDVTVGGMVTGLKGTGLVLTNNGGDDLAISGDGEFMFATPVERGERYALAVKSQPSNPTQSCAITDGSGTAGDEETTDAYVICQTLAFRVGGRVTGLAGTGLVLQNSGGETVAVGADGTFTFPTPMASGASYGVTVAVQPSQPTQTCTVNSGTGVVGGGEVTGVQVTCSTRAFAVRGTVSGLVGTGLVLQNNGGADLAISANGGFAFPTQIASGASYAVTVLAQPTGPTQACTVASGAGTVGGGDVTSVQVTCVTRAFAIGGTVTGLGGTGLVLQNNGGVDLAINANGTFAFATPVASGATFGVTVRTQPAGPTQTCTVSGGTGTVGGGDVTSVAINCTTNRYTIGGTISGLVGTATLQNNGGDDLNVTANGTFAFATPVASGAVYAVTVRTQPTAPAQTCVVAAGAGTVTNAAVTSVGITCTTNRYSVGGTVTGLGAGNSITLRNSGGDDLSVTANGAFAFATTVTSGQMYAVTLAADPTGPVAQLCAVTNGSGIVGGAPVTTVQVTCTSNRYSIGGVVSGLDGAGLVLQNNGGDALPVSANGSFVFPATVASGQTYAVTVLAHPAGASQTCSVTAGTGTVTNANVTGVLVTCTTNRFSVGGTVTGLAAGNSITLLDNGGDSLVRSSNGGFTFLTPVPSGQPYQVTIVASPTTPVLQTCTITNGAGIVGNGPVTNVAVTCTTATFTLGGTVSGLISTGLVLQNNGGDPLAITTNGPFVFPTPIASGTSFSVTVRTQPAGQSCTVVAGTGTVTTSNAADVQVTCGGWSTSQFPIVVPGTTYGLGDLALDGNGDLLLTANQARAIVRINRQTGVQTTIVAGLGATTDFLLGVTYRAANNMIYANNPDRIWAVTPGGAATSLVVVPTADLMAIAIAPQSFGSFGGYIIGVTYGGSVIAVHPTTGALTTITTTAGPTSDLAFAPDGTLYISGGASVRRVSAGGTVTPFVSDLLAADGITITPDGARMFIADSGTDTVRQITIPGGVVTTFATADIDDGVGVGGILAAPGNTLIVMTGEPSLTLRGFTY